MGKKRLGIGFIGSGFITRFHIQSWQAVRDADILGVWSPNGENAESAAAMARSLRVGDARAFSSIEEMAMDPAIDALWICGPNHRRIENLEEILHARKKGADLIGIACEKPLARNVGEARRVLELATEAGVLHGYLEDQLFSPTLVRGRELAWNRGAAIAGRPYLARAAEEHSGPHAPWFWQGKQQGGGVLNDMMCHSVEVARFLLTAPGAPRDSIRIRKVSAQIASLKWSRDRYADELQERFGKEVDYRNSPSEDFARATIEYVDADGHPLIAETTTSWSFVGAGLRLSSELLGPEYSMQVNSLDSGGRLFFSRRVTGGAGEDLVEKQNAEQGVMPFVGNEASEYGYEDENRHFVQCFLDGRQPALDFAAGLEVVELLMTAYMAAEQERTLTWKPDGLDSFIPAVARGSMAAMSKLKWGILSTAQINRRLLSALAVSERSEIVAVASRDGERAASYAREHGIPRSYGSYVDLLADEEVDIVYNPLPNDLHASWTVRAAAMGKHVLCEKPLALRPDDVDRISEAASVNGVVVAEGFMYLHHERTRAVRQLIDDGKVGTLRAIRGAFSFPFDRDQNYRLNPEAGGGALWDVGCYPVSFARYVAGSEPVTVFGRQVTGPSGIDVSFAGLMEFPGGLLATFDCGFESVFRSEMAFVGTLGELRVPFAFQPQEGDRFTLARPGTEETRRFERMPRPFVGEVADMERAVLDGDAPAVSLAWSRGNAAALEALLRSAHDGVPVRPDQG